MDQVQSLDNDVNELEALSALVESDGWQLFLQHVEAEYGAVAYARQMDALILEARKDDRSPEVDMCSLGAVVRKVQTLAKWPDEQIKKLKQQKAEARERIPFLGRRRA